MEVTFDKAEDVFTCAIFLATNCKRKVDLTLVQGLTYKATGSEEDLAKLAEFFKV